MLLKRWLRPLVPRPLIDFRNRQLAARFERRRPALATAELFSAVYEEGMWGRDESGEYYSGLGSHDAMIVAPYIRAVRDFLAGLPARPNVTDLGCGDFNVGRQLVGHSARYVACDVVPGLVARNKQRYVNLPVEFRQLDIIEQPLPAGDVVFLRQVLQHLSNAQIARILPKLAQFKWAVITEHLPLGADFVPNIDKPAGPDVRDNLASGVVLTADPFHFDYLDCQELCSVSHNVGVIRTLAFRLRA